MTYVSKKSSDVFHSMLKNSVIPNVFRSIIRATWNKIKQQTFTVDFPVFRFKVNKEPPNDVYFVKFFFG